MSVNMVLFWKLNETTIPNVRNERSKKLFSDLDSVSQYTTACLKILVSEVISLDRI